MATDIRGHKVPAGSDRPKRADLLDLSLSINATKNVANMTEASQYVTALEAASLPTKGVVIFNESDNRYYGRIDGAWEQFTTDVGTTTQIIAISDNTNFGAYGASTGTVTRYANGQVELAAQWTCKTAGYITAAPRVITTLQPAYRPRSPLFRVCQGSNNERWFLEISAAGNVAIGRYSGTQGTGVWLGVNENWQGPSLNG